MVRSTQFKPRVLTSTPKQGSQPPQELPDLPSILKDDTDKTSTVSRKRRRSGFYKTKKSGKATGTTVRKRRHRPGERALKEISYYQKRWGNLIPKLPFSRLVHEILAEYCRDYRIQALALEALQEASEVYIVGLLERANLCSIHARRVTIMAPDMKLVRRIKDD